MKKLLLLSILLPVLASAQMIIPITNNMVINSNSNIKFIPGNYTFTDPGLDGVIKISGVHDVMIDGDSCTVNGVSYGGFMIKIDNSQRVTIKNFDSVFKYKYAIYISNSSHIKIVGNDFSRNKVDSSGFIDVWADYTSALGGGVMLYQSRAVQIYNNIMKYQNDGVAMYHCDSINIHDNDFAWNTSFGVRMFWTDTCYIYNNLANHINRPKTDPSDCAAILLIIANKNRVEHNDFSYSGDGIFLGQYQHSNIPNNNYFAYNECSYSPHNAIEATFADGNVYKHNSCNYSPYGFWLGYSFNSILDSNDVIGNYNSGIAIDRGFNNSISNNNIINNPLGIELWKGSSIAGYENQNSQDYKITGNTLEGNEIAVSATTTTHAVLKNNQFNYNQQQSIYFAGTTAAQDTVTNNLFKLTTSYHIKNFTTNDIYANNNEFLPNDTALIREKIYDHFKNPTKGNVTWYPNTPGPDDVFQYDPPCDMAEAPSIWNTYADPGYGGQRVPEILSFDTTEKVVGASSVKLVTGRGFDVTLNYRPFNDSIPHWTITDADTLYFWVRTIKNPYGFQNFSVRVGDSKANYFKFTAPSNYLNLANLNWVQYKVPMTGGLGFSRTSFGLMYLENTNYVEIHADCWDYGFTIWVDGVQFTQCSPITSLPPSPETKTATLQNYPNPFFDKTSIQYTLSKTERVQISIYSMDGKLVKVLDKGTQLPGSHAVDFDGTSLDPGVYFYSMIISGRKVVNKMVKL